jgi:surface protein
MRNDTGVHLFEASSSSSSSRKNRKGSSSSLPLPSSFSGSHRRRALAVLVLFSSSLSGKEALCATENVANANTNDNSKNNKNNNNMKEQQQFLTDETFKDAIDKCMRTNPVDGMCAELPKFGAMPRWDTSKVTNMDLAFASSTSERKSRKSESSHPVKFTEFNADLSKWDVSSVTSMRDMFSDCRDFEGVGLETWNTERVETMAGIFRNCETFATDVSGWKGKVTETPMKDAVKGAVAFQRAFVCERDPTEGVMLNTCAPNESIDSSLGEDEEDEEKKDKLPLTDETFHNAIEECLQSNPIGGMCKGSEYGIMPDWDVSRVTDMSKAFYDMWDFNGDLSKWDVKNLKNAQEMFYGADTFNADISEWNTQNLQNCQDMFHDAKSFNRSIDHWKTHTVTNMNGMFMGAKKFNSDISNWDVQNVQSMRDMFAETFNFNQPIGKWNVKSCRDMRFMFSKAKTFKQKINNWKGPAAKEAQFKMFSDAYSFLGKFRCEEQEHGPAQSCKQRQVYNSNAAAALGEARGTTFAPGALGEADVHLASGAMFRHNPFKEAVAMLSLITIALAGFVYTTKVENNNYTKKQVITSSRYKTTEDDEESPCIL